MHFDSCGQEGNLSTIPATFIFFIGNLYAACFPKWWRHHMIKEETQTAKAVRIEIGNKNPYTKRKKKIWQSLTLIHLLWMSIKFSSKFPVGWCKKGNIPYSNANLQESYWKNSLLIGILNRSPLGHNKNTQHTSILYCYFKDVGGFQLFLNL